MSSAAYNPLDMGNLAESIHRAILSQVPVPLSGLPGISGPGIYAIYYTGDFPAYSLVSGANRGGNWGMPIYVGKAVPKGGRKGTAGPERSLALSGRLREHKASIERAANLDIADFYVRWLVVEPVWIPLGESLMINRHSPVWNSIVDGFGNHAPGAGRGLGKTPRWHVLHPGSGWGQNLAARNELADAISQDAEEYLRQRQSY